MFHNFAKPNEELYSNAWTFDTDRFINLLSISRIIDKKAS